MQQGMDYTTPRTVQACRRRGGEFVGALKDKALGWKQGGADNETSPEGRLSTPSHTHGFMAVPVTLARL